MSAEQKDNSTHKLIILKPGEATEWKSAQNDNSQGSLFLLKKIAIWTTLAASAGGATYLLF